MLRSSGLFLAGRAAARAGQARGQGGPAASGAPPGFFRQYTGQPGGQKSGGGGGKVVAVTTALALGAAGGTLGLSAFDPDFRKTVEESVPGAESALTAILGAPEKEAIPPVKKSLPVTTAPPSKKRPVAASKAVEEKKDDDASLAKKEKTLVIVAPPPLEKPPTSSSSGPAASEKALIDKEDEEDKLEKDNIARSAEDDQATQESNESLDREISRKESATEEEEKRLEAAKDRQTMKKRTVVEEDDGDDVNEREAILKGKDLHRQLSKVRKEMEEDMVTQLRRQAEAHTDHLRDQLSLQEQELSRKHARERDEALERAELGFHEQLARVAGHLRGLNVGLRGRAEADRASLQVHCLIYQVNPCSDLA
jgi:mitofilin